MKKRFICFILLFLVCIALVIPKTNAYTPVFEVVSSQPYASFSCPYELDYKFISNYIEGDYHERYHYLDSLNSFVLDSNGNTYNSTVTSNEDSDFFYKLYLDDDSGPHGGLFSVIKEFEVIQWADNPNGFVGRVSGVLSSNDFLNFLHIYSIEYNTENMVSIDFGSSLDVTLSIPIDGDYNNTLTRTFNYSNSSSSSSSTYLGYPLYYAYTDAYNEIADITDTYEIEYLYFSLLLSFDITYYEYSGTFTDYISIHEYVVIGEHYEPSVEAYRSVFGGYIKKEVINPDFSSWLVTGVGSFMNLEIIPGWSIAVILSIMIGVPLLIYILRLFFGG